MARSPYFPAKPHQLLSRHQRWREVPKHLGLSKIARLRLEWIIWYELHEENMSLTCRHFGIARKTFHIWVKRFTQTNLRSLESQSRRPQQTRRPRHTLLHERRVWQPRQRYPTAGRDKLVVLYEEDYGEPIPRWTIRRIIRDHGWHAARAVHAKSRRTRAQVRVLRKKRVTELIRQPRFGFLLEADTIVRYWNAQKRYILTATDTHARVAFARMYPSKAAKHATDFLRRLVILWNGQLRNLHVDNGSEFQGQFRQAATDLGISLYYARPYRAQDKPMIERFNGVLQQEFVDLGNFTTDCDTFNRNLTDYLIYYNAKRPHHSLGLKRPLEVATLTSKQPRRLLPMYAPMTRP